MKKVLKNLLIVARTSPLALARSSRSAISVETDMSKNNSSMMPFIVKI